MHVKEDHQHNFNVAEWKTNTAVVCKCLLQTVENTHALSPKQLEKKVMLSNLCETYFPLWQLVIKVQLTNMG